MNRRTFILGTATTSLGLLSGCAGTLSSKSRSTTTTQTGPKDPIPATAEVSYLTDITNDSLTIQFNRFKTPREATFHLYVQRPTPGTSLTWRTVEYADPGGRNPRKRPILDIPLDDKTHVSSVKHKKDSVGYGDTIEFPHEKQPAGTPLQYVVEVEEHTLDGQSQVLGTTTLAYCPPESDTYHFQPVRADNVFPFDLRANGKDTTGGTRTIRVTGTTSPSRYNVPRVKTAKNRPLKLGRTKYTTGMYEAPWTVTLDIDTEEYDEAQRVNRENYIGSVRNQGKQMFNVKRIYRHHIDGNPILADVARQLNSQAETNGFVTPMQKLRFTCDLIQWMPYTDDSEIPDEEPAVRHPVATLYDWTGDCEDKVAALAGLLHQDAFPDYDLATYYTHTTAQTAHHALAISRDSFEIAIPELDAGVKGYLYVDGTYPAAIDYLPDRWHWNTPELTYLRPPGHPDPLE